jgi:hypothetical protein
MARSVGAAEQWVRVTVGLGIAGVLLAPAPACFSTSNTPPPAEAGPDGYVAPAVDAPTGADAPATETGTETGTEAGPPADASSGGCPAGWFKGDAGTCFVSLLGTWLPSTDANTAVDTVATLGPDTAESVSVIQGHTGAAFAACGCNAQHLQIPLGRTFSCSSSTLEFVYSTTINLASPGAYNSPGLDIRFCTGPCPTDDAGGGPQAYGGPQYVGSPVAPHTSNCAYEWENEAGTASTNFFPASALITSGVKTTVPLGSYVAPASNDNCTGSFDTIDVHMQVYTCSAADVGTNTLSYLRIY